jgi:hypothetical protein
MGWSDQAMLIYSVIGGNNAAVPSQLLLLSGEKCRGAVQNPPKTRQSAQPNQLELAQ